jgi:hypothetical protein
MGIRSRIFVCALLCACLIIHIIAAAATGDSDGSGRWQQTASDDTTAGDSFGEPCGIAPDALSKLTAWLHAASSEVDGVDGGSVPFPFDDIVFACSDAEKAAGVAVRPTQNI